ncbi:uncharacterized protein MONBRDRAFT_32887 [Monosiga brevicollis MX1]|uniref:Carboxylic ester hydrolase n=1 Tax=Monosiga brevicollis TaxID=81824 RepID=A9V2B0_MONBE|nr:uncharacterized protein MONBRDRAFT_32887 [Monosiga brevicollis MX1]EDQ88228.1 predicted protein [Monosiga brevicollis MX1]|eukprot:XP_001746821.1 hypothetical protein [Monosiga brevicollis MX1]
MHRRPVLAVVLCCFITQIPAGWSVQTQPWDVVYTPDGPIQGSLDLQTGVVGYRSIPYAEAPVGRLRYAPPVQRQPWSKVHDGTQHGPSCITSGDLTFARDREEAAADCLTVSVYTPPGLNMSAQPSKPVIIYLHGGGFIMGSSTYDIISPYPAAFVRDTDTILVHVQYRLGPAGFVALPEMTEEHGYAGTLGLLDQRLAMQWVQRNIGAFGGDPSRVTLMGESAGAFSICFHMVAPQNAGLFQRVILQSAMCDFHFPTLEEGYEQGYQLAEASGCATPKDDAEQGQAANDTSSVLDCLRSVDEPFVQEVLPHRRGLLMHTGVRWFPVMDGAYISQQPIDLIRQGQMLDVDVIIGSNADEGTLFALIAYKLVIFPSAWPDLLRATFEPDMADFFLNALPDEWSAHHKLTTMFDNLFACSVRRMAGLIEENSGPDTQVYLYNYAMVPTSQWWPFSGIGAFHSSELLYLFNGDDTMHAGERRVAKKLRHFWGAFAHDAHLNQSHLSAGAGAPAWPAYTKSSPNFFRFDFDGRDPHPVLRESLQPLEQLLARRKVFADGQHSEEHPHELCELFDALVDENGYVHPPRPYDEAWYSWFLNIPVIIAIEFLVMNRLKLAAIVLAAMAFYAYRRRSQALDDPKKVQ